MARPKRPKEFQIPAPGHQPLKVEFCGVEYEFAMPSRLKADALRGYLLAAIAKMSAPIQELSMDMAKRIAGAKDVDKAAARMESEMTEEQKLASAAGTYMATEEIFEFVCRALKLTARERAYAEDNYEHNELFSVFITLQGLLMRPFGGTPKGSRRGAAKKTTGSTGGAKETQ